MAGKGLKPEERLRVRYSQYGFRAHAPRLTSLTVRCSSSAFASLLYSRMGVTGRFTGACATDLTALFFRVLATRHRTRHGIRAGHSIIVYSLPLIDYTNLHLGSCSAAVSRLERLLSRPARARRRPPQSARPRGQPAHAAPAGLRADTPAVTPVVSRLWCVGRLSGGGAKLYELFRKVYWVSTRVKQ